jgi:uncharacterized membrane protein YfcA
MLSLPLITSYRLMRWKLIILTSLGAALIAFGTWSAVVIGFFGDARALALHDWLLLASALAPLLLSTFAGVFVYRHTARRRKTQAILTGLLSLIFWIGAYQIVSRRFPNRLIIPNANERRRAH